MRRVGRAPRASGDHQGTPATARALLCVVPDAPPPGVTVRVATPSDGPALRCLEQRTPVAADGLVIAIDRGDEPLAATRLMDDVMTFVAEYGGEIVAVLCDAYVRARIGGVERQLVCRRYLRIDPEHRGLKLFPALNFAAGTAFFGRPGEDGANEQILVRAANTCATGLLDPIGSFVWSAPVEMHILDCATIAGPPAGRPATPADAAHIVGTEQRRPPGRAAVRPLPGNGAGDEVGAGSGSLQLVRRAR